MMESRMRHPLFHLLQVVFAGTRSLAFGIQSESERGGPVLQAEPEYTTLLIVISCLTGLLAIRILMIRFPDLGAVIAEFNQF
jgi:hypothetical protein